MDAATQLDSSAGASASVVPRQHPNSQPPTQQQPQHTAHATGVDVDVHNRLLREHKRLKQRVEQLERENEALRTSLWEVSWRYGKNQGRSKKDANNNSNTVNGTAAAVTVDEQAQATAAADANGGTSSEAAVSATSTTEVKSPATLAAPSNPEETPKLAAAKPPQPAKPATTTTTASNGTSAAGLVPAVFGETEFMRLNEPIKVLALPPTPAKTALPTSPSSLAATLFPQPAMLPPPVPSSRSNADASILGKSGATSKATPAPSSTSSRTNTAMRDASLKRELDISLPSARTSDATSHESWRWGRGYDLKGHRGAVYTLKFGQQRLRGRGRVLASAGFDGVRLWAPKELLKRDVTGGENDDLDEVSDPWDDGEVEELAHITSHTGPVSDVDFHPAMTHVLSGGYDSQVYIHPLSARLDASASTTTTPPASTPATPTSSSTVSSPYAWTWSHATDGLVQTVAWVHPSAGQGAESMNVFAYGTSGRVLGVGDMRMDKPVLEMRSETMINSIRSFKRSPNLLVGDSSGAIRHFSLRTASFLPLPELSASAAAVASGSGGRKGPAPISCLALSSDNRHNVLEPRWMASTGFDNFIRIYDRGTDPVKMLSNGPKLVHTLKGKNRNWPIKASWFQGSDYVDPQPASKRRAAAASRGRSRSASFSSDHPDHVSSDDEPLHQHSRVGGTGAMHKRKDDDYSGDKQRPLASSMLLAAGSSEPVVLLYDCTRIGEVGSASAASAATSSGLQSSTMSVGGGAGGGGGTGSSGVAGPSSTGSSASSASAPRLLQRLEGHKESVYAVDFLQARKGDSDEDDFKSAGAEAYTGPGLLASAGGDWVVKTWRPVFTDIE
ncbi:hypothetical protein ACM66B_005308 [Microbotryomycetes sp. NB124-2]